MINSTSLDDRSVALITHSSPPVIGGVETIVKSQAKWFTKYHARVSVFTGTGESFHDDVSVHQMDVLSSNHPNMSEFTAPGNSSDIKEFEHWRKETRQQLRPALQSFNTWIAHNLFTMPFNLPLTAALRDLASNSDAQVYAWTHDIAWQDPSYETPDRYPWNLLKKPSENTKYVAISRNRKRQLRELFDEGTPVHVVYDAIEIGEVLDLDPVISEFYRRHELYDDDFIAVYPARMVRRKNFELALRIINELKAYRSSLHLIITGPLDHHSRDSLEYRNELFDLARKLDLTNDVIFCCREENPLTGNPLEVTFDRVKQFYRLSDFLLMTSRQEGFGLPLLEAGINGTIIFCSDVSPLPEVGGITPVYFDPDSHPAEIALEIDEVLTNEMSSCLQQHVRSKFTWPAVFSNQIVPLLKEHYPLARNQPALAIEPISDRAFKHT